MGGGDIATFSDAKDAKIQTYQNTDIESSGKIKLIHSNYETGHTIHLTSTSKYCNVNYLFSFDVFF